MKRLIALLLSAVITAACTDRETTVTTTEVPAETPSIDTSAISTAAGPPLTTTGGRETSSSVPAGPVSVRLVEYRIEMPNTIAAGATTFAVRNDGKRTHSFEIEGEGIESELAKELAPGGSGELRVDLKAGRYKVYCPVGNHEKEHGMVTTLTVR